MLKNPCHRILGETGSWSPQLKLNKSVSDETHEPSRDGRMTRSLKVKRWVEDKKTNEQYAKHRQNAIKCMHKHQILIPF